MTAMPLPPHYRMLHPYVSSHSNPSAMTANTQHYITSVNIQETHAITRNVYKADIDAIDNTWWEKATGHCTRKLCIHKYSDSVHCRAWCWYQTAVC